MADHNEQLTLHNLHPAKGSTQSKKRRGRGPGSGLGKTAGRGHKGQKSRSGGSIPSWFEGGQMPLIRRIPKRGFINPFRQESDVVNLYQLDRLPADVDVTPETLLGAGLVRSATGPIKILAQGDVSRAFVVRGVKLSAGAKKKIEAAGGKVEA